MEIYKITNIITGKCYIGKTTIGYIKRFNKHIANCNKGINRRLYDSMRHHGIENFTVELIYTASTLTELNEKEIEFISLHESLIPNGYNMTLGGDGGYTLSNWTEEEKQALYKKQSENRIGFKHSDETKKKLSEIFKGRSISEDAKNKVSNSLKVYFSTFSVKEKQDLTKHLRAYDGSRKGCKHSDETKIKCSRVKKGKKYEDIYTEKESLRRKEAAKLHFTINNPLAYDLTQQQKDTIMQAIYSKSTAVEISIEVGVTLWKLRQLLRLNGINNLQKYRGNKKWKINHESWSLLGELQILNQCKDMIT